MLLKSCEFGEYTKTVPQIDLLMLALKDEYLEIICKVLNFTQYINWTCSNWSFQTFSQGHSILILMVAKIPHFVGKVRKNFLAVTSLLHFCSQTLGWMYLKHYVFMFMIKMAPSMSAATHTHFQLVQVHTAQVILPSKCCLNISEKEVLLSVSNNRKLVSSTSVFLLNMSCHKLHFLCFLLKHYVIIRF